MRRHWKLLLAAVLMAAAGCGPSADNSDVSRIEKDIRAHLPIGSSKAEVFAYLEQRKISAFSVPMSASPAHASFVVPEANMKMGVISGIIRVKTNGPVRSNIQIDFKLDPDDSKLISYTVRKFFTAK